VFCLDESGSMSSYWPGLLKAVEAFLEIRISSDSSDLISVIQFQSDARVTMYPTALEDAVQACRQLVLMGGGTEFRPAVKAAAEIIRSERTSAETIVVFMSDGECSDADQAVQAAAELKNSCVGRPMQFYGVAFQTSVPTLARMVSAIHNNTENLVSASNVQDLSMKFEYIAEEASAKQGRAGV